MKKKDAFEDDEDIGDITDFAVKDTSEKRKKPILFAGSIFYRHVIDSMKLCQGAMLTRNFEQWTVMLLDINSKLAPFMSTEKFKKINDAGKEYETTQAEDLRNRLMLCVNKISNLENARDINISSYLLKNLLNIQFDMFNAAQAVFVGLSEADGSEFESDQEDGG